MQGGANDRACLFEKITQSRYHEDVREPVNCLMGFFSQVEIWIRKGKGIQSKCWSIESNDVLPKITCRQDLHEAFLSSLWVDAVTFSYSMPTTYTYL